MLQSTKDKVCMCVISHKDETSNNLNLNIGKNSQTANMVNNFEGKNPSETLFWGQSLAVFEQFDFCAFSFFYVLVTI